MNVDVCTFCRAEVIGGGHTHWTMCEICKDEFKGDWEAMKKDPLYGSMYFTQANVCVALTPMEALIVS